MSRKKKRSQRIRRPNADCGASPQYSVAYCGSAVEVVSQKYSQSFPMLDVNARRWFENEANTTDRFEYTRLN